MCGSVTAQQPGRTLLKLIIVSEDSDIFTDIITYSQIITDIQILSQILSRVTINLSPSPSLCTYGKLFQLLSDPNGSKNQQWVSSTTLPGNIPPHCPGNIPTQTFQAISRHSRNPLFDKNANQIILNHSNTQNLVPQPSPHSSSPPPRLKQPFKWGNWGS